VQVSIKSDKLLQKLGVVQAFAHGDAIAHVGPVYELRKQPGSYVQLIFTHDDEKRICVGYAQHEGESWNIAECEPYSMRSLGYWERRLKRIGQYVGSEIPKEQPS
jgi:hypothetical protein